MEHRAFTRQQERATLDGVVRLPIDIAYIDQGRQGAIETVVLLHGIPTWSYLYHDVIPILSNEYRVVAPDLIGHGWSERRDIADRSLEAQARMVIRLLDHLDLETVHLVGHDTGGGVGQILALDHPERLKTLTLTNAVAYDSWPIDDMIALGDPRWAVKDGADIADFVRQGLADGISRPERLTEEWACGIIAPYSDREGALSLIRSAAALNTNHTSALTPLLHTIRIPTLVLWGVDDPWQTFADAERLHRDIPTSTLVPVAHASHWIPQDAPVEFTAALLAFLASNS